jgi:hypothetical protein
VTTAERGATAREEKRPSRLVDGLIRLFGDLKIFPAPLFLAYDPGSYRSPGSGRGCAHRQPRGREPRSRRVSHWTWAVR